MNTHSNVVPGSALAQQAVARASISESRKIYWLMRRELWENRWLYKSPLVVAGLFLLAFLVAMHHLPEKLHAGWTVPPPNSPTEPYDFAAMALMAMMFGVALYYSLESLYSERRDRSILFWKSLPVSDLETVLSKAAIPILAMPVITFVITAVTQLVMLLIASFGRLVTGHSVAALWGSVPLIPMWIALLYHLVGIHGLWLAPVFGWVMLVSAWARRAPLLWATLPPFAIGALEKLVFGTSHFGNLLLSRFVGGSEGADVMAAGQSFHMLAHLHPGSFLVSPGLWGGFAFTAVCLFLAARVRRYQGPA